MRGTRRGKRSSGLLSTLRGSVTLTYRIGPERYSLPGYGRWAFSAAVSVDFRFDSRLPSHLIGDPFESRTIDFPDS